MANDGRHKNRGNPLWPVLKIVGIYALVGCLWIVFSDAVLGWFVRDPLAVARAQTAKGLLYVATTAGLLYALINRQVRKYHDAEQALRRSQEQLLEENHERQQTEEFLRASKDLLGRKTAQLQEADKRKNEFLAMLAHELRNPLSPIRTTAELLRMNNRGADANIVRWLAILNRQVDHLARIVDDLLDTSRLSRGLIVLQKQPVNLADSVAQAVEMNREFLKSRRQRLELELPREPLMIVADPVRVVQIIFNLLQNATKFTGEEGQVAVAVSREGEEAVIVVRDNGIGIAPENRANIFDLFYQADVSLDRTRGGLGLGLTLVKRLADLHGGSVAVTSEGIGRGSTFEVRLPLNAGISELRPEDERPAKARAKILVVEADQDAAEALAEVLKGWNFRVWTSPDGERGLQLAKEIKPELVLMDIREQGLHGYKLCADIRAESGVVPVIQMALLGRDVGSGGGQVCFDRFLTKPVRMKDLEVELKGALASLGK